MTPTLNKKKKICIFIENDFILRSYLETFTFQEISSRYSIELILTYKTNTEFLSQTATLPVFHIQRSRFHQFFQTVLSIRYWFKKQESSNSFSARILSLKLSRRVYYSKHRNRTLPSFSIMVGMLFARINIEIFHTFFFLASKEFRQFLSRSKPDLVICVTSGGATSNSDSLSFVGQQLNVPVLSIVENWDNLTSKAVFNIQPDFIGVWGSKDKQYAVELHQIPEKKVFLLGSPRVSQLLNSKSEDQYVGNNLLFAGGSIDIEDELLWLNGILKLAETHSIPVIYVPHPSNYNDLALFLKDIDFPVEELIPQEILELVLKGRIKRYPKLSFYQEVLRTTRVTISPYSTLLLESLLYGIPGVGIDFKDPLSSVDGWTSEKLEHLTNLDFFPNYFRVTTDRQLEETFMKILDQNFLTLNSQFDKLMNFSPNPFYHLTENFSQQLIFAIEKILSKDSGF